MLQGLDVLHKRRLAHRDIKPDSMCFALDNAISTNDENEIQEKGSGAYLGV